MLPLVTVVVPVYRIQEYINECVDSIIRQSYKNIEIILVDDGSDDQCPEICDNYAAANSNIRVLHKQNGGLSSARNAGIEEAAGEYITFIDGDDIIAEDMIETMVDIALKESADIVKISLIRASKLPVEIQNTKDYKILTPIEALNEIYAGQPQVISACGKLFKTSLFEDICFPEGYIHEDEFITPKLYYKAEKIAFCEAVLYYYMQRENDSILRSNFNPKRLDVLYVMEDRIEFFNSCGLKQLKQKAIVDYYCHIKRLLRETKKVNYTDGYKTVKSKIFGRYLRQLTPANFLRLIYNIL